MLPSRKHNWLLAAGVALLLWSGCNTDYVRMYEQRGEHYKAHQLCREALLQDPQNQAAAAGLLRNAPAALTYWREQALAAATTNDWRRAAVCHQQVLLIKPDEKASIDALRRLADQHPDQIALPIRPDAVATTALVKPPTKVALAPPPSAEPAASKSSEAPSPRPQSLASSGVASTSTPEVESSPIVAVAAAPPTAPAPAAGPVPQRADKPAPRPVPVERTTQVASARPPASGERTASKSSQTRSPRPQTPVSSGIAAAPPPAPAPVVAAKTVAKPLDEPSRPPIKQTTEVASAPRSASATPTASESSEARLPRPQSPVSSGIPSAPAPTPAPPPVAARTVASRADRLPRPMRVARRVNPYRQKPTVRREDSVSEADMALVVYVSRDDPRYAERALLTDGIFIRVKDTDFFPLDADMELYLGSRRVAKLTNLRTGSVVTVLGRSGEAYELVLLYIDGGPETVKIGLRRVRRADSDIGQLAAGIRR